MKIKIRLKDSEDEKWEDPGLLRWNKDNLRWLVFRDENAWWELRHCLKKTGAFYRRAPKFTLARIMKEDQRKREGKERMRKRDVIPTDPGTFGRLYNCTLAKEGRAMVDYGAQWRIAIASLSFALFWLV